MAFHIDNRKFHSIRSYEQAEAVYKGTNAIRGRVKEFSGVPLRSDRRNGAYMRVIKTDAGYACRLYNTNVVLYRHDGAIDLDLTYESLSTRIFADTLSPFAIHISALRGKSLVHDKDGAYYAGRNIITLVKTDKDGPTGSGWRVARSTIPAAGYPILNRKRAADARKRLAPFLAYLHTMRSVGAITQDAWKEMRDSAEGKVITMRFTPGYTTHLYVRHLRAEQFEDPELFPAVAAELYRNTYNYATGGYWCELVPNAEKVVRDHMYDALQCFDIKPLAVGEVHRNMQIVSTGL